MRFILSLLAIFTLGLGVLTACQNSAVPFKTQAVNTNTASAPKTSAPEHQDDAPRITLADAKKEFDANNAVFIDTRSADAFKLERVKGAINITTNDNEARYKEIPKGKKIIVYCSWPNENSSAGLVRKLKEKGIDNAYALLGGTKAWKDAGYPMESGETK